MCHHLSDPDTSEIPASLTFALRCQLGVALGGFWLREVVRRWLLPKIDLQVRQA